MLRQYPSLTSYFASQPRSDPRLTRLKSYFSDLHTEVHLLFLESILPLFTELNKVLQCEGPKLHVLLQMIQKLARKLIGRCVKEEVLASVDETKVNVDIRETFLDTADVMIGFVTRSTMMSHDFNSQERLQVAKHCQRFMVEAYKCAMSHLSIQDPVLLHAEVLQNDNRFTAKFDSLLFFVEKVQIRKQHGYAV